MYAHCPHGAERGRETITSQGDTPNDGSDEARFAPLRELAYEESLRWLDNQAVEFQSLHTRAGTLLAGITAATAFIGGIALNGLGSGVPGDDPVLLTAAGLYLAVGALCVAILFPKGLHTVDDAQTILDSYALFTIGQLHHQLASFNSKWINKNKVRLTASRTMLSIAALLAVAEIALWLTFLLWRT